MRMSFLFLAFLMVFSHNLFSNGGPSAVDYSKIYNSGNIELTDNSDIKIEKETIVVTLEENYATVNVQYRFFNKGDLTHITYGFPIRAI